MTDIDSIEAHVEAFYDQFNAALIESGRTAAEVTLLAVSKRQPLEKLHAYERFCTERGLPCVFGENYAQELLSKKPSVQAAIHFIGGIQSNKIPILVGNAAVIETLSSEKHARGIHQEADRLGIIQDCYVQVNVSSDDAKHGIIPEQVPAFIDRIRKSYPALRICGLMTITRFYERAEDVRPDYQRMKQLYDTCKPGKTPFALSMGMSADYQIALQEGATEVRIGSALFGPRLSR